MTGKRPGLAKARRLSNTLDEALGTNAPPSLVREILGDLDKLLDRGPRFEARLRGDSTVGEAWLIRRLDAHHADVLRLHWKGSRIEHIEVQSRRDLDEVAPLPEADPADVVERVAPMIWSHLRTGGLVPRGTRRFAPFFSLSSTAEPAQW